MSARGHRLVAFAGLVALTALELVVIRLPVERAARITALSGLAITKVAILLLVFMRLPREPRALRLGLLLPFLLAPAFVVVLMLEAAFRARVG
jgi:heme/copper-type cytochrome/quinol oxidase subunit 4